MAELRPIDQDHFWIGEVMVDLNQLRYEAQRLQSSTNSGLVHEVNTVIGFLCDYGEYFAKGNKPTDKNMASVKRMLLRANAVGLHTGYREEE